MKRIDTGIPGLCVIEPVVFGDERGHFFESYNARALAEHGITATFVQDNQSRSRRGILRGLHYQVGGTTQDKLVRCIAGAIFDVAVDLRQGSPTFGRWFGVELTGENKKMLWVPKGFAHGFLTLSEQADVGYKVTDYWSKNDERGVRWDGVGILWPDVGCRPELNARDAGFPAFSDIPTADLFNYTP
jgi:dTDP-4-dehydrorhamnose 3,5-epimerase